MHELPDSGSFFYGKKLAKYYESGAKLTAKALPKKSKYQLSQKINTKQAGTYLLAVKVTYPDKSTWTSSEFIIEVAPGAESGQSN